jgi:hypothetical protein
MVIWMQTCAAMGLYDGQASNFCRFESARAAVASGKLLLELWSSHPNLKRIGVFANLEDKVRAVEQVLTPELAGQ